MLIVIVLLALVYTVLIAALLFAGVSGIAILAIGGGLALFQFFASDKLALRRWAPVRSRPTRHPSCTR